MTKQSGGTRNYRISSKQYQNRLTEYNGIVSTGVYRDSNFYEGGGYYVVHKDHNQIVHKGELGEGAQHDNREDVCAEFLAKKGYKIYLMSEKSYITGGKKNDGFLNHAQIDIKTINSAGKYTIKAAIDKAASQGAEVAILFQNTKSMTQKYVQSQFDMYMDDLRQHPNLKGNMKEVIVVGLSGRIHRRKVTI